MIKSDSKSEAVIFAPQVKTSGASYSFPTYKSLIVNPNTANDRFPTDMIHNIQFDIPKDAINFAKSRLLFLFQCPALADNRTVIFADTLPFFSNLTIMTKTGRHIANIENVDQYLAIVNKAEVDFESFRTHGAVTDVFQPVPSGEGSGYYGPSIESIAAGGDVTITNRPALPDVYDYRYSRQSGDGGATVIYYSIPLSIFKNTILEYDQDLMFPEILVIQLTTRLTREVGFQYLSAMDADLNTTAIPNAAGNLITGIHLDLKIETNIALSSYLHNKVMLPSGFSMMIPFVWGAATSINTSNQVVDLRYSSSHGRKLRRIYHTAVKQVVNPVNRNSVRYWRNNEIVPIIPVPPGGGLADIGFIRARNIRRYYVNIDSRKTTDEDLDFEDASFHNAWEENKKFLEGSSIQTREMYERNWMHIVDFGVPSPKDLKKIAINKWNIDTGRSLLTDPVHYQFVCDADPIQNGDAAITPVQPLTHYTFAITSRMLRISPNAVILE